ncbi:protein CHROMOSOME TRANSMISSION FIDELITY 7-like [Raphanus sativus]|uniref:Protein CHROMOSOME TRANSMISSION FIDELITY 7-like n=1 Tax=Raphanus sativus TaxID=3726 RepID=A0A9W3CA57_RAPSA|nr:protein CHROMOSOME TRANSMISSION FIDELITY 7-like [Raphanus sativus]
MQSKINYFFKPSSPSPIATSVTPDTTDDSLAAWENNRNVIVNTYQRRSPKAVRSEVLKEPIGERPRKGPKTLNKKKRSCYTQFHLELGQSDFLFRHCVECGATYAPGDELDEKSHQSFHKDYTNGIPFKGWQNERAFTSPSLGKNRIVVVLENDSPAHRNKVQEVVKMMEVELGEDWILHRYCKVYLLVSSQRISGCLVAEPIKEAFKIISRLDDGRQLKKESSSPSTTIHFGNIVLQRQVSKRCRESDDRLDNGATACEEEAKPAFCGVRAIWVSPSNRRKGLATQLLDTARESFSSGCILEKSQLAFSQPSSLGRAFGCNYFGTSSFLVYIAQLSLPGPVL